MTIRYLYWNGPTGKETIDELDSADFSSARDFRDEMDRLADEYAMAGTPACWSQRPCAGWQE